MNNFEEYLRQGEPNKAEKAKVWKMAIGLQQVDGVYIFHGNSTRHSFELGLQIRGKRANFWPTHP
jgi:ornithine carbamoyltransferase